MTKLTLTEQEELFAKDCKLINLRYEYTNYTGKEKWAVITELTEKELRKKYPDIIKRYTPFVLLSMAQGEVINESDRNDVQAFFLRSFISLCGSAPSVINIALTPS